MTKRTSEMARMRNDPNQLALDLFGESEVRRGSTRFDKRKKRREGEFEGFLRWAFDVWHCDRRIEPVARKVFDEMDDPFDRGKALVHVCSLGRYDEREVEALGLFEEDDYHVCWDRAYAIGTGIPVKDAARVQCYKPHSSKPRFYDAEGNLVGVGDVRHGARDV